jgi:inositol-phosphate phosphatase/L-galactose 1-phosphate phosphatase/histidinol-phosphatase
MQAFLDTILDITDKAAAIPRDYFRARVDVIHKSDATPVTVADRATEELIRAALARHFPDHGVLGEEFGLSDSDSPYCWIIDPIDGTRAFISGMPLYGMLVGLLKDGVPVLGVVRMPELDEVYASNGVQATLNGQPLATSQTTDLSQAMVYINEADKLMRDEPEVFKRLNTAGRDRRYSYDCYPHALVAAGHVDACIDFDLKPYDILPLVPIVAAAGGVITDWQGQPLGVESDGRVVTAATPALHAQLLDLINQT